jgi:hypothetical protein
MLKSNLIAAIQFEIRRHNFSTFVENSMTVPGCSTCKKKLYTIGQFMDHLADNIPGLINRLSEANQKIGREESNR